MEPIKSGELHEQIGEVTAELLNNYGDNEILVLETKDKDSVCHFFPKRLSLDENQEVQLRVDWKDLIEKESPTIDADFYDKNTGSIVKKLSLAQKKSHHTKLVCKEDKRRCEKNTFYDRTRCYEWLCEGHESVIPPFKLSVEWLFSYSVTAIAKMTVTGTVIKGG